MCSWKQDFRPNSYCKMWNASISLEFLVSEDCVDAMQRILSSVYPSPGEEGQLKRVLEQDEVDEVEEETGPVEPEEVVAGLHDWDTLHDLASLLDPETHLGYDHLELRPDQEDYLQHSYQFVRSDSA